MFNVLIELEDRKMRFHGIRGAALLVSLVMSCSVFLGVAAADDPWVDPKDITIPKLNKIKEIKPDRVELENGMVVYFLEDHDFPLVDVRALMRVGAIYEPPEKAGLASITGQVMRTGGSTKTEGDALDVILESMGASVEINIGNTDGAGTVSTLSEDLEQGLRILGDLLRTPAFPEDKIDLAKKQERTAIASRNDEHLNILFREMLKIIYGPDHPYARHTEYATIDAITRDDLVAFHKEYVHPDRMIMTVYGDFKRKDVEKLLNQVLGDWPRSTKALPPDPEVAQTQVQGNFLADKADLENSIIVVGHEGMRMDNPDYAAMQVFHEIMGGGFSSRLVNEIRSKRGLAYATGSFSGAGLHHPGPQGFYVMTQADSTIATLGHVNHEIEKALADGFTEEELTLARDSILNSLVFSLSSKGSVLNRMAVYEFYGYPMDFLDRYQEAIQALAVGDILAAGKRNVRYPAMATVIVGEKVKFESDLASLGEVTEIDITIPEPMGEEIPAATEADLKRGQELLAAAAGACGAGAMAELQDMTLEESGTISMQGMDLQLTATTVRQFPDCEQSKITFTMGTMTQSVCGDVAWLDQMQGPQEMPTELKERANLELQALGKTEEVDGGQADVIHVRHDKVQGWKIYVDQATHRIVRMDYRTESPTGGPVLAKEFMKDYREIADGVSWPHGREVLHDDEPFLTMEILSVKVNTGVDPATFQMPE
jgi:predicted Zn-dependent peptidase